MDTLYWVLCDIEKMYGFRANIFCWSDGAEGQQWSKNFFGNFPAIISRYAQGRKMGVVRVMKKVSSHGKGQIDSAHAFPKKEVREFIDRKGAESIQQRQEILDGFQEASYLVEWLGNRAGFNELLPNKPDKAGFPLRWRKVKYYAQNEHGSIENFKTK